MKARFELNYETPDQGPRTPREGRPNSVTMAQRFVAACAVLAGPRLGVRAAKGDGGKRPPPGPPPDRDDDKYEGPDGKDGDEWEGDEEDWDESEGEDYDKEKSVEGNEWCLWEVKREFVNYGVNGGQLSIGRKLLRVPAPPNMIANRT